jgi:hypothetical protein
MWCECAIKVNYDSRLLHIYCKIVIYFHFILWLCYIFFTLSFYIICSSYFLYYCHTATTTTTVELNTKKSFSLFFPRSPLTCHNITTVSWGREEKRHRGKICIFFMHIYHIYAKLPQFRNGIFNFIYSRRTLHLSPSPHDIASTHTHLCLLNVLEMYDMRRIK